MATNPPIGPFPGGPPLIGSAGGLDSSPRGVRGSAGSGGLSGGGGNLRHMPGSNTGAGTNPGAVEVYDREQYAVVNGELVLPVGVVATPVLAAPTATYRSMLMMRNSSDDDTKILYVAFGSPASLNSVLRLERDEIMLFDAKVPQGDVYAISEVADSQISILFSVFNIPQASPP